MLFVLLFGEGFAFPARDKVRITFQKHTVNVGVSSGVEFLLHVDTMF